MQRFCIHPQPSVLNDNMQLLCLHRHPRHDLYVPLCIRTIVDGIFHNGLKEQLRDETSLCPFLHLLAIGKTRPKTQPLTLNIAIQMAEILGERHLPHTIVNAVAQECRKSRNHAHGIVGGELRHELDILKRVKEKVRIEL